MSSRAKLEELERAACYPRPPEPSSFNPRARIPHGLTTNHIAAAMVEFTELLGFINQQLRTRQIPRLETMLMPANFSSIVGEFIITTIPKYCITLAKNAYHNGHPDLIPAGRYPENKLQHGADGIEIKASRYLRVHPGSKRGLTKLSDHQADRSPT